MMSSHPPINDVIASTAIKEYDVIRQISRVDKDKDDSKAWE